jgi:hypothetical protein
MATCGLLSEWRMRREPRYQSFVVSEMGWCMWYWFFSGVRRVVSQLGGRIELIEQRVASDGTRKLLFQVEAIHIVSGGKTAPSYLICSYLILCLSQRRSTANKRVD